MITKMMNEINIMKNTILELQNQLSILQDQQCKCIKENEEIKEKMQTVQNENKVLNAKIQTCEEQIEMLNNKDLSLFAKMISNIILANPDESNGILEKLKNVEIDSGMKFDPLFVASQSSNDIYNIINPDTKDQFIFLLKKNEKTFFQIELEKPIILNAIEFNAEGVKNQLKYFSIEIENDDKMSKFVDVGIKEFDETNEKKKVKKIPLDPTECKKIKIIPNNNEKLVNFDKKNNEAYLRMKKIELFSPDPRYSDGYFKTLIKESFHKNSRKIGVNLSSSRYDFNKFHLHDVNYPHTTTFDKQNSWFQIELTKCFAFVNGFRLKCLSKEFQPLKYKIIATYDYKDDETMWHTLYEGNDKNPEPIILKKFSMLSPPVKFIRIVQLDKNSVDYELKVHHFDIFGILIK